MVRCLALLIVCFASIVLQEGRNQIGDKMPKNWRRVGLIDVNIRLSRIKYKEFLLSACLLLSFTLLDVVFAKDKTGVYAGNCLLSAELSGLQSFVLNHEHKSFLGKGSAFVDIEKYNKTFEFSGQAIGGDLRDPYFKLGFLTANLCIPSQSDLSPNSSFFVGYLIEASSLSFEQNGLFFEWGPVFGKSSWSIPAGDLNLNNNSNFIYANGNVFHHGNPIEIASDNQSYNLLLRAEYNIPGYNLAYIIFSAIAPISQKSSVDLLIDGIKITDNANTDSPISTDGSTFDINSNINPVGTAKWSDHTSLFIQVGMLF